MEVGDVVGPTVLLPLIRQLLIDYGGSTPPPLEVCVSVIAV